MALTPIPSNLQETMWAAAAWKEAANKTIITGLVGKGDDSVIVVKEDLSKGAGDTLRFGITMNLSGAGVTADNTLIGNEEQMDIYDESVTINQFRNAIRLSGRMDRQRSKIDMRKAAKTHLSRWLADHMEEQIVRVMSGDTTANFGSVGTAATHVIYGGVTATTASAASTASAWLDVRGLERLKERAQTRDPAIRPIKGEEGGDYYVVIMHPTQFAYLRMSAALRTAWEGAAPRSSSNPLFKPAKLVWNGLIIYTSKHIYAPASGARRAILLGQQAGCFALGEKPFWTEDTKSQLADYGNKPAIACGRMAGFVKTVFNSVDHGVYCFDSYAPTTGMAGAAAA